MPDNTRIDPLNLFDTPPPRLGFNWEEFFKKLISYAAIIAVLLTIIGGLYTYVLRTETQISDLRDRVGTLEGQNNILLKDRTDINLEKSQIFEKRLRDLENKQGHTQAAK